MKEGPDVSIVAASVGEPARANMLMALMSGMALTATELAREAGVTPATASSHLSKLEAAGLVVRRRQGRHRFYALANADVAHALEALTTVAARVGHLRTRPGPRDQAMRTARSCYDHLAGRYAADLFADWLAAGILADDDGVISLTESGHDAVAQRGIDIGGLTKARRVLCRGCLDWSERRNHLGGSLGAAVLRHIVGRGWAVRDKTRIVAFKPGGVRAFTAWANVQ